MALDLICQKTRQHLYALDDESMFYLAEVRQLFYQRTGQQLDPYEDLVLDGSYQLILRACIDDVICRTDLNADRLRWLAVMAFRGVLDYFIRHQISVVCYGD